MRAASFSTSTATPADQVLQPNPGRERHDDRVVEVPQRLEAEHVPEQHAIGARQHLLEGPDPVEAPRERPGPPRGGTVEGPRSGQAHRRPIPKYTASTTRRRARGASVQTEGLPRGGMAATFIRVLGARMRTSMAQPAALEGERAAGSWLILCVGAGILLLHALVRGALPIQLRMLSAVPGVVACLLWWRYFTGGDFERLPLEAARPSAGSAHR